MILSNKYEVTEVKKKTRVEFFKDIKVGDEITVLIFLSAVTNANVFVTVEGKEGQSQKRTPWVMYSQLRRWFDLEELSSDE